MALSMTQPAIWGRAGVIILIFSSLLKMSFVGIIKKIRQAFRNDPATDKDGKPYFSQGVRRILKLTGLYDYVLIKKIRKDILSR